jgi:hypothetical protein
VNVTAINILVEGARKAREDAETARRQAEFHQQKANSFAETAKLLEMQAEELVKSARTLRGEV